MHYGMEAFSVIRAGVSGGSSGSVEPLDFEKGAIEQVDLWDLVKWNHSIFKFATVGTTRFKLTAPALQFVK